MKKPTNVIKAIINKSILLLLAVSSVAILSCKQASDDPEKKAEEQNEAKFNKTDEKDAEFVSEVAMSNMKEIQLGQLAQKQGVSEDVKNLGKMMETDHGKSLEEIKALAAQKNITIPASLSQEIQDEYNELAKKTGSDFDIEYAEKMVDAHEKNIKKFEDVANNENENRDRDIKNWANKSLPTLRMHFDHSTMCRDKVKKTDEKIEKNRKNDNMK